MPSSEGAKGRSARANMLLATMAVRQAILARRRVAPRSGTPAPDGTVVVMLPIVASSIPRRSRPDADTAASTPAHDRLVASRAPGFRDRADHDPVVTPGWLPPFATGVVESHTCLVTRDRRLGLVLGINLLMVLGLLLVGLLAHSLGVLASGADYLGDALGTGLSLVALRMSRRKRGYPRATSFAALANANFLLLVTLGVAVEAVHRLSSGAPTIHAAPVVIVSVIAAIAMIGCVFILGDVEDDLSMQSVMLDTVADAAAAVGVAVSGAIILLTKGTYWLDSLIALTVSLIIAYHAAKLIRKVLTDLRGKPAPL